MLRNKETIIVHGFANFDIDVEFRESNMFMNNNSCDAGIEADAVLVQMLTVCDKQ